MKLSISLNKPIDCNFLCSKIKKLIDIKISKNPDLSNLLLCIDIKEIKDELTQTYIEYKHE
jgi:hypothetical protein